MEVPIKETTITNPKIAKKIIIHASIVLNEKAIIRVEFWDGLNNNGLEPIDVKMLVIEGQEYKNWGTDDNYIKNLVFSKLELLPAIVN